MATRGGGVIESAGGRLWSLGGGGIESAGGRYCMSPKTSSCQFLWRHI